MDYDGKTLAVSFHKQSPVDPLRIIELSKAKQFKGLKFTPDFRLSVPMPGVSGSEIIERAEHLLGELCTHAQHAG